MSPERTKRFNMVVSEEEDSMLRELAEANHTTASEFVRAFVRREHTAMVEFEDAVLNALGAHGDRGPYLTVDGLRARLDTTTPRLRDTLARLEAAGRIQLGGKNTVRVTPEKGRR